MSPRIWIVPLLLAVVASPAVAKPSGEATPSQAPKICKLTRIWGSPAKPKRVCLSQSQWDEAIVSEADVTSYHAGLRNQMDAGAYPTTSLIAAPKR
jgi:hypothetical protein